MQTSNYPLTVQTVHDILIAVREKLAADMLAASRGPRGGRGTRGVQIDTTAKAAAWILGRLDADFLLPPLGNYYGQLRILRAPERARLERRAARRTPCPGND